MRETTVDVYRWFDRRGTGRSVTHQIHGFHAADEVVEVAHGALRPSAAAHLFLHALSLPSGDTRLPQRGTSPTRFQPVHRMCRLDTFARLSGALSHMIGAFRLYKRRVQPSTELRRPSTRWDSLQAVPRDHRERVRGRARPSRSPGNLVEPLVSTALPMHPALRARSSWAASQRHGQTSPISPHTLIGAAFIHNSILKSVD